MTELPQINKRTPIPKPRGPKKAIPTAVRDAARDYKAAYKSLYGMEPALSYDPAWKWVRVEGQSARVSVKRLKEMTVQLRYRLA